MNDPADRHLEERLHALARGVSVPVVPPADDVRRGRRRLLRMRLAMAGGTTATLAVVLGITGLTAGDPTANPIEPAPPVTLLPTPTESPSPSDEPDPRSEPDGADGGAAGHRQPPASVATTSSGKLPIGLGSGPTHAATAASGAQVAGTTHGPSGSDTSDPVGTASTTDPTPTDPATTGPTAPTEPPSTTPTTPSPTIPPPTDGSRVRVHPVLRLYNRVLAEHLDPDREHLDRYDRRSGNKQTTRRGGELFALGSTYSWRGTEAQAGLRITVASGWDQAAWDCGASYSTWECRPTAETGAVRAEVARHDGIRQVAVEHDSGQVVLLTTDPTYADEQPRSGAVDLTDAELLEAAADPRLTLPGDAPVSPPQLDVETFEAAGLAALVRTGESFDRSSVDRTPEVIGGWGVDGAPRGTLSWSATPTYSGAGWVCGRQYRTCTDLDVDGRTVHVGALRNKLGGGWVIGYDGPSYAVRVYASDRAFPKKRAHAFVTADDWQPVR